MTGKKKNEIIIAGFGGQGIILTGAILGKAAVLFDGKHAIMTQSYGPEARGGSCSSQVIISEDEILSPSLENPRTLLCMNQEGYEKNIGFLSPAGLLVWDTDLVEPKPPSAAQTGYDVPCTRIAEELGNKMMANIVLLGFFSIVSEAVSTESLKQAVLDTVPPRTVENNSKAFDRGREYAQSKLGKQ
ncbi:MAG: 2-oxoacid:acceptor oxidoreductase family protein [Deltaproteobacteria bacterium]|nr:2-oxoacid:acceptor oxidoreductase family protein [Deltaproteobacteria bacterium]